MKHTGAVISNVSMLARTEDKTLKLHYYDQKGNLNCLINLKNDIRYLLFSC